MYTSITNLMSTGSTKPILDKPGLYDNKALSAKIKKTKIPKQRNRSSVFKDYPLKHSIAIA